MVIPVGGRDLAIPGYMVWAALLYALSGSLISWRIGRPLVRLGSDRYAREADFRFALVQGSERAEGIALSNGEADSRRGIETSFGTLIAVLRQLAFARVRLTWVTAGYGWVALVFPIVVAAPGYFAGRLSFGELMMVVGAFNQVQQSLRWFVDNTGSIADWRATLLAGDELPAGASRPRRRRSPRRPHRAERGRAGPLQARRGPGRDPARLHHPRPAPSRGPAWRARADPRQAELGTHQPLPGDRGALERRLGPHRRTPRRRRRLSDAAALRAIRLAARGSNLQRRCARGRRRCARSLKRVGLDNLTGALDTVARWDRDLGLGEQERLCYARLLLARPKWLICDEGLDPLDEANRQTLLSILARELAESAVINISQRREPNDFYGKVVHLIATPSQAAPPENALPARAQRRLTGQRLRLPHFARIDLVTRALTLNALPNRQRRVASGRRQFVAPSCGGERASMVGE